MVIWECPDCKTVLNTKSTTYARESSYNCNTVIYFCPKCKKEFIEFPNIINTPVIIPEKVEVSKVIVTQLEGGRFKYYNDFT